VLDVGLSREEQALRERARDVREGAILPFLAARGFDRPLSREEARALFRLTLPLGYPGTVVPAEDGGAGLGHVALGLTIEELAPALGFLGPHVATRQIAFLGTPEHKRRYLPGMLAAELIGCVGITEPGVGSDAGSVRMTAERRGARYVLNGTKAWLAFGSVADLATVLVATDPAKGPRGLSRLIVDLDYSRLEVRPIGTLGDRLVPFVELTFRDYEVPAENLLGREGEGLRLTLGPIQASRASMATHAVGLAQAAIDAAIRYVKERSQFGRPIGGFQLVQGMLANMIAETEAARLLAYRVWAMIDRGEECAREASIAKLYATESAVRVTSQAVQLHGANGVSDRYPVERYFRDARMLTFPDGTSEVHQLLIGRGATGLDAFRG
jgi:alkylation response protein AidB-like acyl-CoA dehydrogenase